MTSLARSTAGRAVHLRIHPRPQNLGESREILRLVSGFGEVEYFRNLKFDALSAPQTALAIFKNEEAATACIKRCPIRFRLGPAPPEETAQPTEQDPPTPRASSSATSPQSPSRQPTGPSGTPFGISPQSRALSTAANRLPSPPRKDPAMPFIGDIHAPPPEQTSRLFQLSANEARARFRDQIDVSHYHGSFAIARKTAIQADLEKKVPLPGLSCWDWRAKEIPWKSAREQKEAERDGPNRRKRLRELYEEGLRHR